MAEQISERFDYLAAPGRQTITFDCIYQSILSQQITGSIPIGYGFPIDDTEKFSLVE